MKISKKDGALLLVLVGVLVVVAAYYLVYQDFVSKTDVLRSKNSVLASEVATLQAITGNVDVLASETERMTQEIEDIYASFPVDVREEDALLLAINQEQISPMTITSMAIDSKVSVDFSEETENAKNNHVYDYSYELGDLAIETGNDTPEYQSHLEVPGYLMTRKVTLNYSVAYEALKNSIINFSRQNNRMAINNINLAYDENTGLLSGTTTVDMYFIPSQEGKEYMEPDFSAVMLGTDNIFKTMEGSALLAEVEDAVNNLLNDTETNE